MVYNLAYLLIAFPLFCLSCGILGSAIGRLPEHPDTLDLVPVFGATGSLLLAAIAVLMILVAAPPPVRRHR